jgi:Tfp pilus assembly protein PilE
MRLLKPYLKPDPKSGTNGFTFVEVMIIISLIGVLTAVGTPVINSNVKKAMRAEADAALASIKIQLDVYCTDNRISTDQFQADYIVGAPWNDLESGELTGKYFTDSSYTYSGHAEGKRFKIYCSTAPLMKQDRTLDQDGILRNE